MLVIIIKLYQTKNFTWTSVSPPSRLSRRIPESGIIKSDYIMASRRRSEKRVPFKHCRNQGLCLFWFRRPYPVSRTEKEAGENCVDPFAQQPRLVSVEEPCDKFCCKTNKFKIIGTCCYQLLVHGRNSWTLIAFSPWILIHQRQGKKSLDFLKMC